MRAPRYAKRLRGNAPWVGERLAFALAGVAAFGATAALGAATAARHGSTAADRLPPAALGAGGGKNGAHAAGKKGDDRPTKGSLRFKSARNRGTLGHGHLLSKPPKISPSDFARLKRGMKKINPSFGVQGGDSGPPQNPPIVDTQTDPQLGPGRGTDLPTGSPPPSPDAGLAWAGAGAPAATGATAAGSTALSAGNVNAAAANDFAIFRSQQVATGFDANGNPLTSRIGEPTVANDRNALLYTGNWHTAVSSDNGITWQYVNPFTQFGAPQVSGGFCCDQVALASDRGSSSLVFWLRQYLNDGTGNTIRLTTFEGRDELIGQDDACNNDFTPQGDFDQPNQRWLDFNQMGLSNDFLYISSNIYDIPQGNQNATWQRSVVWRIPLDELNNAGDCDFDIEYATMTNAFAPSLVQKAGSTMYWASHTYDGFMRVWRLADSSSTAYWEIKDIWNFSSSNRGDSTCPVPDGTDPCSRIDARMSTGWMGDGVIGWMWSVAQNDDYPFPHTRVLLLDDSNRSIEAQYAIYATDRAWILPAAGVNARGHLGFTLNRMGGSNYPGARAIVIDDVDPGWDTLATNGIVTSDSGTSAANNGGWGDYAAVRAYGDCENSWAAAVWSMQGGTIDGRAEHRFAWFGRERDGCADYVVERLDFFPTAAKVGDTIALGATTRNIGSGYGGEPSQTRFYLSRDDEKSSGDLHIAGADLTVPDLGPSDDSPGLALGTIPAGAGGAYYVLACADALDDVDEITGSNNCTADEDTIVVPGHGEVVAPHPWYVDPDLPGDAVAPGMRLPLEIRIAIFDDPARLDHDLFARIWLSRLPWPLTDAELLLEERVFRSEAAAAGAGQGGDQDGSEPSKGDVKVRTEKARPKLPSDLKRGHWYVVACQGRKGGKDSAAYCTPSREPIHVEGRSRG